MNYPIFWFRINGMLAKPSSLLLQTSLPCRWLLTNRRSRAGVIGLPSALNTLLAAWSPSVSGMVMILPKDHPPLLRPCSNGFGTMWERVPFGWRELSGLS